MAELHLMSKSDGDIKTHVVFIHGLGGHHEKTWLSSTPDKGFWPNWLSEEIDNIAIWSVGYLNPISRWGSPKAMHFTDRAKDILHRLSQEPLFRDGEIIFVGHSMGGLMIKQMFHYADRSSEVQSIMGRVTKVCFLATPHRGSSGADLADRLRIIALPSVATASLLKNDPNLRELNEWYRAWVRNRDIDHLILMENQPCKRLLTVVTPDSADPGLNTEALLVDADHLSITKLPNKQSQIYQYIKSFVVKETKPPLLRWLDSKYQEGSNGWQGYSNWSNSPKGVEETYIVDEQVRLFDVSSSDKEGKTGIEAIQSLRSKLGASGTSTRLVGLSGVGKTRLVQALFDERVGEHQLPADQVLYTDMGHAPIPTPRAVIEKLVAEDKKAIVIIDNCPPELHRDLAPSCKKSISLLTIEYDIREDQPEATGVLSLEPASDNLITSLLKDRFTHLSDPDARKIAEFSGGNARIAIALASTVEQSENISHLKDDQLFKRLFHQRHQVAHSLEKAAQALSLVYSFQFEDDEKEYSDDLVLLSHVSKIPANVLYESAQELKRRNLIQQRGMWMAVLPHPIANRLAKIALENIPKTQFLRSFNEQTEQRILKSASRRIGYLDDCENATNIVKAWLDKGGAIDSLVLGKNLSLAITLTSNVAPILPEQVLRFFESISASDSSFLSRKNPCFREIAHLLRSLAYSPEFFSKSANMLAELASSEKTDERGDSTTDILKSLFYLYLSGTKALKEQRLSVITSLVESKQKREIELGLTLLDAALKSSHFSSHFKFDFGSRSRDYGYEPKTYAEIIDWYKLFINYAVSLIVSNSEISKQVKATLEKKLHGLWHIKYLWEVLEQSISTILENGEWSEGWLSINSYIRYNSHGLDEEELSRTMRLSEQLTPKSLHSQLEMLVLKSGHNFSALDELDEDRKILRYGHEVAAEQSEKLGYALASANLDFLISVLPEIVSSKGNHQQLRRFGEGCAQGVSDPKSFWELQVQRLRDTPSDKQSIEFSCGFLGYISKSDTELTNTFLDNLLVDKKVGRWLPILQFFCPLDSKAVKRLKRSITNQLSPIHFYQMLGTGRIHEALNDDQLCEILELINSQPDGTRTTIDILSMKFHGFTENSEYKVAGDNLRSLSQETLIQSGYKDEDIGGGIDYSLFSIASVVFSEKSDHCAAKRLLAQLKEQMSPYSFDLRFPEFLEVLVKLQPLAALENLLDIEGNACSLALNLYKRKALSNIDTNLVSEWCSKAPSKRYIIVATAIRPYKKVNDTYSISPIAKVLLSDSPEPEKILDEFKLSLSPSTWSGSLSSILKSRLPIFDELQSYDDHRIKDWAINEKDKFMKIIKFEEEHENNRNRQRDERFEW
ncbi:esterase/lipase family protein [Vibrio splendidus]|uniref:esterase/lipase family protein n=1 Tax=Vibrio splendidus TaxID=29497 RepID=UPI000D3C4FC6|nr:alpha/beta hydrolase [Vibrio splendidus]PTP74005.1 hypothetical protein CWO00_15150 [Vibrio splendidus]